MTMSGRYGVIKTVEGMVSGGKSLKDIGYQSEKNLIIRTYKCTFAGIVLLGNHPKCGQ